MATLRDPLFNADLNLSARKQQQLEVDDMSSLRRGWEAGRVGNELNPLYTEELEAGIAGQEDKRQALRTQIDGLKQKQSLYAPEVGRVEDINGVGDGLSWLGGQVGQGAASMLDPMAVSAGLGTVGRIAGAIPHPIAKGVGLAAQGAALGIPALMSKRQLTGEFIGSAEEDPELMARTSKQGLRDTAGDYGTLAAIPDSFLPGMVGRQISGLSRAGSQAARQGAMGAGAKTALGMGVEGGTEALQSAGSQYAQGTLNPNRGTSGDFMENVNSFAGGAVGAGPFAAAGALAEAGHNRVDGGVDAVRGAAGDVVDVFNESPTVQAGIEGGKKLWGSAKEKAAGAVGSTVDIMRDEDGKVSAQALVDNFKAGGQELKSWAQTSMEEHQILSLTPPEEIALDTDKSLKWMNDNLPKRTELITSKLAEMDDPQAAELMDAITSAQDAETQDAALDNAAEFVLAQTPIGRTLERGNSLGESMGKIAGVVGPAIGKGIVATGKAALGFGKSVLSGAQDGMRKKNEQSNAPETFMAWRDRYYGVQGQKAAAQVLAEADPVETQRADLAGNYIADMAGRLNKKAPNMALLARHAAFTIADTVMRVNAKGIGQQNVKLNRLVDDLYGTFRAETPEVLAQLGSIMGPKAAPVFEYLTNEAASRGTPGAARAQAAARDALASQAVSLVDPAAQNALIAQGINLNTPRGREQLLGVMEDFADGIGSATGMRKALDKTFGAESVQNILTLLNGVGTEREPDVLLPEVSEQETKDAEKLVGKGSGQKVFGFSKAPNLRTSGENHDAFAATKKTDTGEAATRPQLFIASTTSHIPLEEVDAWNEAHPDKPAELVTVKGVRLGKVHAATRKIDEVRKQLASDPDYPDHENHNVVEKSAYEVMTESDMQPTKILQLHRDYLIADGNTEDAARVGALLQKVVRAKKGSDVSSPAERAARRERAKAWSARNPGKSVEDYKAVMAAERTAALAEPLAAAAQAAKEYFSAHSIVVGEQITNQDAGRIALPDILNLHKDGQGLIGRSRGEKDANGVFKAYPLDVQQEKLNDANVLMFKNAKDPSKTFSIPAGKLVNWVKQARGKTEATDDEDTSKSFSNKSKDEAYLADVMEGIATLIGSGYVSGMPYKVNQFGKVESFSEPAAKYKQAVAKAKSELAATQRKFRLGSDPTLSEIYALSDDNQNELDYYFRAAHDAEQKLKDAPGTVPPSLRLATRTAGAMQMATEARRGPGPERRDAIAGPADPRRQVDARYEAMDADGKDPQFEVAKDQDRQAEFFTAEDRAERDLVVDGIAGKAKPRRSGKDDKREAASATDEGGQLVTRRHETEGEVTGEVQTDWKVGGGKRTATFIPDGKGGYKEKGRMDYRADVSGEFVADPKTGRDDKTELDFSKKPKDGVPDEYANQRWLSRQTGASTDGSIGPEPKGTAASSAEFRASKITSAFISDPAAGQEMIRMRIRSALRPEYTADKNAVVGGVHYIAPVAYFASAKNVGENNLDLPAATITAIQSKVANILLNGQVSLAEKVKIARLMFKGADTKVTSMNVNAVLTRLAGGAVQGKAISAKQEAAPEVAKAGLPKGVATLSGGSDRKLNAMAVDIHTDLQRDGFAATHDSPIKHEGKFDWRAHQGKGEGNASFGAGTYLSTADGVHRAYKSQFTAQSNDGAVDRALEARDAAQADYEWYSSGGYDADEGSYSDVEVDPKEVARLKDALDTADAELSRLEANAAKSPTYEVSVDIKPDQLLDWNALLSEQSALVQKALAPKAEESIGKVDWVDEAFWPGDTRFEAVIAGRTYTVVDHSTINGKFALMVHGKNTGAFDTVAEVKAAAVNKALDAMSDVKGSEVYSQLVRKLGSQAKASDYLQSLGILGHKYAAAGGRNDKHPNYVVYDDAKITTNYVHFSKQEGNARVATQAEMDAAKNYALKVLGPKIKVEFKDITGYSGEFIDATNVIEISTTAAAGTLGTLYHEAMHVFFRDFVKGNPKVQAVFESLINDPKHIAKLHSLLDGYPAAQAQLTSGEERLAYTYQFWKAGLLQVDTKAHTWLQKVGRFFRHVLGMVRDSERALELFQAFDNGKMSEPSAAGQVIAAAMNRGSGSLKVRAQTDALRQGLAALVLPAGEILGKSSSPTARKLSAIMFTNPGEEAHGSEQTGLMNARSNVAKQYINTSNRRFETMSDVDKTAVQKYLQSGTEPHKIADKEQREAVKDIRNLLDRFHKYMTDAGLKVGKVDNYYPVVWNANLLNSNKKEFISLLVTKYADQMGASNPHLAAERIWRSLVDKEGVDAHLPAGREDGVLSPFFASQENRTLPWLEAVDREKYLDKDMPMTLTRYFTQGAHATEYFRRFGENGIKLEKALANINIELSGASREMMKRGEIKDEPARVKWVARQMRDVSQSVGAMEGTLGKDVSPNMRTFNSWMAVYQNIRLLPMALFSSFVDPLALVARGAPLQAAYETFVYGMREVFRGWADAFKDMPPDRQKDEWRQLAEHIGASEIAMFQHQIADQYSSTYMTPGAKKLNDKMFTFNGMESWNRGSRIMATKWAVRFIEKHAALPDKNHSERWLKELGLQSSQIVLDDGKLVTSPQQLAALKGITLDDARQRMAPIHDALNRWVEGAVLTPNAAQRPAWSSDPNYASAFHLKQFSYSFHQTILKRAANELNHGNIAPIGALALFIPTMITADIIKGLIQGGGSLPPYMASMNAGDWMMHGAQRAGLAGIGEVGLDAGADWASLGGPAFEQIIDAARDGFGSKSALKAMPLNSLYGQLAT